MKPEELIKKIEDEINSVNLDTRVSNYGVVETVGDGIATATGLSSVGYGEEVEFENKAKGLVLNLDEDIVSIVLLSDEPVTRGMKVYTTGKILGINVSDKLIGRVIDPMCNPLDEKELKIDDGKLYPFEKIAAGIIERSPVDRPIKTGIKAVDSMIPIGRGQRELIIGDRGTGKTAIAIDTIINQKKLDLGLKRVICIYCAIGQKRSNVASIVAKLKQSGAMDYTIVVSATASDNASLQYIAPFAACAIGEYFMDKGEDVLVVYDDLTKHAWAYRQLSLLLRKPAGREAYPGDIFYLHSRLLERAVRLSDKNGGGTLTALPIIETQGNDVSAYIPTNVISITDGQIYLEADLFNAGVRPALNVGLSVSRVGGAAQTKPMKQLAGPVRLELSQFRELQSFAQFGSDLDDETLKKINRGKVLTEILKQPQYNTYDEVSEIIAIYCATSGCLDDVKLDNIMNVESKIIEFLKLNNVNLISKLLENKKIDKDTLEELKQAILKAKGIVA